MVHPTAHRWRSLAQAYIYICDTLICVNGRVPTHSESAMASARCPSLAFRSLQCYHRHSHHLMCHRCLVSQDGSQFSSHSSGAGRNHIRLYRAQMRWKVEHGRHNSSLRNPCRAKIKFGLEMSNTLHAIHQNLTCRLCRMTDIRTPITLRA